MEFLKNKNISPENMYTSNIMWTTQAIFRNICPYMLYYIEEEFGGIYVRAGRKKGKGEILKIQKCCMISKIKEPKRQLTLRVDY